MRKEPRDPNNETNSMVQQVIENMMNTEATSHLSPEEQDAYLQNSLRIIQELSNKTVDVKPTEEKEFQCIDIFSLRILSLLVCRGTSGEKAAFLAKLVNRENIKWDDERLHKAIKILLYCSSILPNKFLSIKREHNVFKKILCYDPMNKTGKQRARNAYRLYSQSSLIDNSNIWTDKDIQNQEEVFEDVFNQFFSLRIRNRLFEEGVDSISHQHFIHSLTMPINFFDLKNIE